MTTQSVSYSKYVQTGTVMIIMCAIFMLIYTNHFKDQITYFDIYHKDTCVITSIEQKDVTVDCWQDNGYVVESTVPCVRISVNTTKFTNLTFYRNIPEKKYALDNDPSCSYIPTACSNDASYMSRYLQENYLLLFPTPTYPFDCFLLNNESRNAIADNSDPNKMSDAVLYIPDVFAYYTSIAVISLGFVLGTFVIIYGFCHLNLVTKPPKYLGILNEVNTHSHDENFYNYVKKVLDGAHIDVDEVLDKEVDIQVDDESDSSSRTESVVPEDSVSNIFDKRISTDKMRRKASKLKMGDSEIHIGRIEYKKPSSARLSIQGSQHSLSSNVSEQRNESPTKFYLEERRHAENTDTSNDENESRFSDRYELDIPDAILEEDERYLTIQKNNYQNEKKVTAEQVFGYFPKY